jgi:hypothetical protein
VGSRLNWYINEIVTLCSFAHYHTEDWGINFTTASIKLTFKLNDKFTVYPSYRDYDQTAATYFRPYKTELSVDLYNTADYDLSEYHAVQAGIGHSYADIFAKAHLLSYGIKRIDLTYDNYSRDTTFNFNIVSFGIKFVQG